MTDLLEKQNRKDRKASESSDHSAEGDVEPIFEPIITLPEVTIVTNEENEEVLLKLRAKLYRFDTSGEDGPEWKERGTGEVKLLRHKENNTVRVVMRRDKTLKVCANHFITPWMELKPSVGSDKAFVYTVIADFADEIPKSECLAIRFGREDFAEQFKTKFNEAREYVKKNCSLYNDDEENVENKKEDLEEESGEDEESINEVQKELEELNVSKEEDSKDEKEENKSDRAVTAK